MLGYYGALDIAKTAIINQRKGIEVASHNIANVNTPGFHRQVTVMETAGAVNKFNTRMMFGTGVKATEIRRVYDRFVNYQINDASELLGRWDIKKNTFEQIEMIFNESPEFGLNHLMNEFWNGLYDLSNNPEGSAERTNLISRAETMAGTFNQMDFDLRRLQKNLNTTIGGSLEEINEITSQIAKYNSEIAKVETRGVNANDLRDSRDLLLQQLSSLIGFNSYEGGDGKVTVMLGTGKPLVEGNLAWELRGTNNPGNSNYFDINWIDSEGNLLNITDEISGGKMKGWIETRDTFIPDYLNKLDDLAKELIEEVNRLHSRGVGLKGFQDITGTFNVDNPANNLDSANLPFDLQNGSFTIDVLDANGAVVNTYAIAVDPANDNLNDLVNNINIMVGGGGGEIVAEVTPDGELRIHTNGPAFQDHSFAFTSDTSDTLMALGMNTFFDVDYNSTSGIWEYARTMEVNSLISDDISMIAAASVSNSPGDGSNASAMAGLRDESLMNGNQYTFADYYGSLVGKVGVETWKSGEDYRHQQAVVDQLEGYRESISGVSLDEEMINLIKFQKAYEAAARIISVVDEMLDTLINLN